MSLEIPHKLESISLVGRKELHVGKIIKKKKERSRTICKLPSQILLDETSVNGLAEQTASIVHKFYDAYVGFATLNKANFFLVVVELASYALQF